MKQLTQGRGIGKASWHPMEQQERVCHRLVPPEAPFGQLERVWQISKFLDRLDQLMAFTELRFFGYI
ncbi:hypothetical protein CEXT_427901 [Caerostris extrusa]|uniref:Uncharacterized protein n=1 Tax=Caerostris extrusa TaxID=172846 RepID=A0AAV4W2H0_CAEEX|nr:hypothetical protein CEXT_427901 [Caerostris extrusa]